VGAIRRIPHLAQ